MPLMFHHSILQLDRSYLRVTINTHRVDVPTLPGTMISVHRVINAKKLLEEKLPSPNYRISGDQGEVEFARMHSPKTYDLPAQWNCYW
jgi:hypothetical protein